MSPAAIPPLVVALFGLAWFVGLFAVLILALGLRMLWRATRVVPK